MARKKKHTKRRNSKISINSASRTAVQQTRNRSITARQLHSSINPQTVIPKSSHRLLRRKIKKQVVIPAHPKQPSQRLGVKRGTLRSTLQLRTCRLRKAYKKTMLKQLAAQNARRGSGALNRWRKQRRQSTNIIYRC